MCAHCVHAATAETAQTPAGTKDKVSRAFLGNRETHGCSTTALVVPLLPLLLVVAEPATHQHGTKHSMSLISDSFNVTRKTARTHHTGRRPICPSLPGCTQRTGTQQTLTATTHIKPTPTKQLHANPAFHNTQLLHVGPSTKADD